MMVLYFVKMPNLMYENVQSDAKSHKERRHAWVIVNTLTPKSNKLGKNMLLWREEVNIVYSD